MNNLKVGFGRVQITPPLGIYVDGYFIKRYAEKILDDLYANAVAFDVDGKRAVVVAADVLNIKNDGNLHIREYISSVTGLDKNAIFLHCTHTHTGPIIKEDHERELEQNYFKMFMHKICDAVVIALADVKPARLGFALSNAPRISFGRRFRMKDGTVRTNPGVNNPDILEPIGEVDERVAVIRIDREGADSIAIINFATHPDTIGGSVISADWPGFVRSTFEGAVDNVKCLFLNGAQGDINHINAFPRPGEENGLHKDFDDVDRGYDHAIHMGRVVAGAALMVYGKVNYVDVDSLSYANNIARVPGNIPDPSEIPLAEKYYALHEAGKDDEIPYKAMMLTTMLARFSRIIRMQNGPEYFEIPVTALKIGRLAFVGIAGEPFTGVGMALKEYNDGYDMVVPCCLINGSKGYFPMMDSYTEGGYEAESSSFKAGVAELIIEAGKQLLRELKK